MANEAGFVIVQLRLEVPASDVESLRAALGKVIGVRILTLGGENDVACDDIPLDSFLIILEHWLSDRHQYSTRLLNALQRLRLEEATLSEFLESLTLEKFLRQRDVGQKTGMQLTTCLAHFGLRLGMTRSEFRAAVSSGQHPPLRV